MSTVIGSPVPPSASVAQIESARYTSGLPVVIGSVIISITSADMTVMKDSLCSFFMHPPLLEVVGKPYNRFVQIEIVLS